MAKTLPPDIKDIVTQEVLATYTHDEIRAYKNFQDFWEDVDINNAYEEEWESWKRRGIKSVYLKVYYEYKKAVQ